MARSVGWQSLQFGKHRSVHPLEGEVYPMRHSVQLEAEPGRHMQLAPQLGLQGSGLSFVAARQVNVLAHHWKP